MLCGAHNIEFDMAEWVPQNEFSSVTAAARSRTAYLAPLVPLVTDTIIRYFDEHPDGEEVTLSVLHSVGKLRLKSIAKGRSFERAKQDLGLLVAQMLVDIFGAMRVQTLRREDRQAVSARRNTWHDLPWVNSYAPHRVLPAAPTAERIFLDSSVVRKIVHGDSDALDLGALRTAKGAHPISLADGAFAELAAQLVRGSVQPAVWAKCVAAMDAVLDDDFPVAPGGKDLAAFWGWGSRSPIGLDLGEARAYYRAIWGYLRDIKSAEDLSRRSIFQAPSGRAYAIQLSGDTANAVLADAGTKWAAWISKIAALISDMRKDGKRISEDDIRQLGLLNLCLNMGMADAQKLDLVFHVLAKRAIQAAAGRTPYNPKGEPNDPLDLDLLFGIPLPGWVCTSDLRFHRLVRSTDSKDKDKVMTPAELLARLGAEAAN